MARFELTDEQAALLVNVIGHALDQDHDTYEGDYLLTYGPKDAPFDLTEVGAEEREEWLEKNREYGAALEAAALVLQGKAPADAARQAGETKALLERLDAGEES